MDKRYNCGVCGESFKTKAGRRKHKKEKHGGYFKKKEVKRRNGKMEEKKEEIVQGKTEEKKPERKSPIQKVAKILVPKEQAKEEWKKYCQILKKRKDKHLKIMKEAMYHAKKGRLLLDVYEAMKKAGINSNKEPRLAIARADSKEVRFEKQDEGAGVFDMGGGIYGYSDDVKIPQKTFKVHWEREDGEQESSWRIKNKQIKTKVPIVPADLMPEGDLKNYYIIWEVKTWEQLPETKDPFLLKRISENLFVILGAWEVTELERAIIGGGK